MRSGINHLARHNKWGEDKADRGGKTASGNGQAWGSPKSQRAVGNGENWL